MSDQDTETCKYEGMFSDGTTRTCNSQYSSCQYQDTLSLGWKAETIKICTKGIESKCQKTSPTQ